MNNAFPYKWSLKDAEFKKDRGNVFSCFSCGGGSTMGYKLAGFDVIGANDIDKQMAKVYRENHKPELYYLCDIRELNKKIEKKEVDERLYDLDILDGSPPCSTFSMAGSREKAWNKEKQFREGQSKQRLDDLYFHFIETARLLQPKIIVSENVKGIILGNAKGYVLKIKDLMDLAGYDVQIFLLNAATMGVPQKRERVFIIGKRKDLKLPKLKLEFNEKPISYKEIRETPIEKITPLDYKLWKKRLPTDNSICDINLRLYNKNSRFNSIIVKENKILNTIASSNGCEYIDEKTGKKVHEESLIKAGTFPLDYNFLDVKPKYLIGMSVPPVMMAQLANQVFKQLLKNGI